MLTRERCFDAQILITSTLQPSAVLCEFCDLRALLAARVLGAMPPRSHAQPPEPPLSLTRDTRALFDDRRALV
jgi:hypothetical protein